MIGSLWTGISGLATHQAALDNESHNIANVNTIGYKSSRISFADQMYQDAIGKGSKVIEAEKIYSQGNIKNTGVAYDVALEGSGFLVVKDPNATGSSEEYFTRAGNLRMGENGTLQDANLYDVIGWTIAPIDPTQDVESTNPNITRFTNDYVKIAANQIVQKSSSIETITAKLTDYTESALDIGNDRNGV
ncbi:MAG: flagellar hook basal-body protein [Campylobacterales bacterium]|nr:flagellar hook basal-body protein [Campylobacterales bacterium]